MKKILATCFMVLGLLVAGSALADTTTLTISDPNAALSGFTGPYATVLIDRSSTTSATVTFTSLTNGGYLYLMGDGGTADLNVNGTYSLGTVTESNSIAGFTPTFDGNVPGVVDGFGSFNLSLNNFDGFKDSATSVSFGLTATGATSWASAASVLTASASGHLAAVHAFACAQPGCSTTSGAAATGFATDGGTSVPEPGILLLLGAGLVGLGAAARKRVQVVS